MDDRLMLGILLIIVGVAIGLIAVALVLNRREDRLAAELEQPDEDEQDEEASERIVEDEDPELEVDEEEDDEPVEEAVDSSEPEEAEAPAGVTPRERHLVAEVYREEVTGRLIVRTADQEYTESRQIEDQGERRRLAYAASDLSDWFQGEFEFGARTAQTPIQATVSPDLMLEEINEILQRSLIGHPERGVRLIPDAASGVKVLIGVKSYEIDDVPDEEIKDLIRAAVAEWEADQ